MRIIVPTRGRRDNQLTVKNLTPELRKMTTIVCPPREVAYLSSIWISRSDSVFSVVSCPDPDVSISQKRVWILGELCGKQGKVVMLDDDLRFCVRRDDDPKKFRQATPEDVNRAFQELEEELSEETPHAGFGVRGGGISDKDQRGGWQEAKRMIYSLGYHVPTVWDNAILGRIETREDMDVTLQLLRKGFPNRVSKTFVTDQGTGWGAPGGCTGQRTVEASNADAKKLAGFHPEFVRVVSKSYKDSGVERLEVVCQWERALAAGRAAGEQRGARPARGPEVRKKR